MLAGGLDAFLADADRLLTHRRSQRGRPTLGDEHDERFLARLASLPTSAAASVATFGESMGRHVYSKQSAEDSLRHALTALSGGLERSGLGTLVLDGTFHREAQVTLRPSPAATLVAPELLASYGAGILRGFLSESLNCEAHAQPRASALAFAVSLGAGRDVNRRGSP